MGRSDDPFWSRPASPPAGGPDDFFGEQPPAAGYENADDGYYDRADRFFDPGDPVPPEPGFEPGFDPEYEPEPELEPAGRGRPERTPSGERRSRKGRRRNLIWRWRRAFFIIGLAMMALVAGGVAMVAQAELPEDPILQQASFICPAGVTENCSAQNAMVRISADENRDNVSLDKVPDVLIKAVISAEDRDFFTHQGVDPMGIGRAFYTDLHGGGVTQGGSTITQQLVKNSYLGSERTVTRKIKEAVLAIKVEQSMSKDEILEKYLNRIYFGRNAYGVQAASRAYFNKDVGDLGLPEASYLAGLIRAPSVADAQKHPQEATRRRLTVLNAMLDEGYITKAEHDFTNAMTLDTYVIPPEAYKLNKTLQAPGKGMEYITEYVKQELTSPKIGLSPAEVDQGGLRVYTTIDPNMQTAAWNAIYDPATTDTPLNTPELPEGALVAIDDQGHVKAMVGGRNPNGAGTNFAVRGIGGNGRPVGSTFKPIALAEAMQEGYSLAANLPAPKQADIQQKINGCLEKWEPGNYNDSEYSTPTLDLASATKVSSNTAYANLMYQLSEQGTDTKKVRDMAIRLGMDKDELSNCLPIVLGASSSTPMEMAEIYSTFANQGKHKEPTVITRVEKVDQDGKAQVLWDWQPDEVSVLTPDQANKVSYALQQVVQGGTGHDANLDGIACAGKTGTTSSNKDAWFVGFTPKLTAAVWMGYPDATWTDPDKIDPATGQFKINPETGKPYTKEIPPMTSDGKQVYDYSSITGGTMPAKIWHAFMQAVAGQPGDFIQPTPEQLQEGRFFEGVPASGEPTDTTLPTDDTSPSTEPPQSVPSTTTSSTPSSTDTTSTSTPDGSTTTSISLPGPPFTGPGGGGGGGGRSG